MNFALLMVALLIGTSSAQAEDWKGEPETSEMSFGAITGLGIVDSSTGYALMGTLSKKIVHKGFAPDINDSVSIEGMLGPVFVSGVTAVAYSAHLRWDFNKDSDWTLFALGGLGGNYLSAGGTNRIELAPRFGVGAFWKMSSAFWWRGDIAHDLIALGINVPL